LTSPISLSPLFFQMWLPFPQIQLLELSTLFAIPSLLFLKVTSGPKYPDLWKESSSVFPAFFFFHSPPFTYPLRHHRTDIRQKPTPPFALRGWEPSSYSQLRDRRFPKKERLPSLLFWPVPLSSFLFLFFSHGFVYGANRASPGFRERNWIPPSSPPV